MEKGSFGAFLAGMGIGVAVGMLFAPKAGGETREILKNKAGEGKEYLRQRSVELKDQAGDLIDKGKEALNRQKDTLADALDAGKQAYRDAVGQAPPPSPAPGSAQ
jgi:gas vesicle protein